MNLTKAANINHLWGNLIVEELIRLGCDYFCLSPGSRSAPLVVPIAQNPNAKSFIHYDERGTAFHALGYTSATLKPSVIVCTSGTAVANFLPAVVEASKKKLPLIVLTADRPSELRKTGGDQTIDQPGIFGKYVRWQFDMPCPTEEIPAEFVLTTIDQAVYRAQRSPGGPVHLNCMFREPLAPLPHKEIHNNYLKSLKRWTQTREPFTHYIPAQSQANAQEIKELAKRLQKVRHGIIAVGKLSKEEDRNAALRLAQKLNWPVFADITSGLRLGSNHKNIIHHYDQILLSEKFQASAKLDVVLHLGGKINSKRFNQFLIYKSPNDHIMVLNHPLRNDPSHNVSLRFETSIDQFCESLTQELKKSTGNAQLKKYQLLSQKIDSALTQSLHATQNLSEPAVARLISEHAPKDSALFLASSMPIREMDMYAAVHSKNVIVGANRGASGIDGTIATAAGFAKGLNTTTTLLIGDLAFLHDLNSLVMLKSSLKPIVAVVVNNDGCGIFSFLPIAQAKDVFEKYFGTPHGIHFENAAQLFDLNYSKPKTRSQFISEYTKALNSKTSTIIEVTTDRKENYEHHRQWQERIRKVVEAQL